MQLAFREQPLSTETAEHLAAKQMIHVVLGTVVLSIAGILAVTSVRMDTALTFAAAISLFVASITIFRAGSPRLIFFAIFGPFVAVIVLYWMGFALYFRPVGVTVFGIVSLVVLVWLGRRPFDFYYGWLRAHPRLRPETRAKLTARPPRPSILVLFLILGIATIGPFVSNALTLAVIFGLCAFLCTAERCLQAARKLVSAFGKYFVSPFGKYLVSPFGKYLGLAHPMSTTRPPAKSKSRSEHSGRRFAAFFRGLLGTPRYSCARQVLAQYITYGQETSGAPGIWVPPTPRSRRKYTLIKIAVPLVISLTSGLHLFFPWDLFEDGLALRTGIRALSGSDIPGGGFGAFSNPFTMMRLRGDEDFEVSTTEGRIRARSLGRTALRLQTYAWAVSAIEAIIHDKKFGYVWMFPATLLIGVTLIPMIMLAVFRRPLVACEDLRKKIEGYHDNQGQWHPGLDDDGRTEWEWYVERLRSSKHVATDPLGNRVREAAHLFLGAEPFAKFPVLLDRAILYEHCYIVGDTGAGKTSLAIMPLLMQLIRGYGAEDQAEPPPPIVVVDLKGDPALFHTVRTEVEARREQLGIKDADDPRCAFRFFTPELGKASYAFNPFDSFSTEMRTDVQLCQLLLESLNLHHGEGYGRSYYSRRARFHLLNALKADPPPRTFVQLYETLMRQTSRRDVYEAFELVSTIHALTHYDVLMTDKDTDPAKTIHMPTVLEHGQCAYFWLPSAIESVSVREIAKLALFALLSAAVDRQRNGHGRRQAFLVVDEFQRIAGENFKIFLEQARSFGLSAILANQTQSDLKTHDIDLRATIRANTRFKQYLSVTDPSEVEELSKGAGEELAITRASSVTTTYPAPSSSTVAAVGSTESFTESESEIIKRRFVTNDILGISDHPLDSIVHVSRGSGYTQFAGLPIPLRSTYPIARDTYEDRLRSPWPVREDLILPTRAPEEVDYLRDKEAEEQAQRAMKELWDHVEGQKEP